MTDTLFAPTAAPAFPLRPYQVEALDAIDAADAEGIRRPLVVSPTGSGKTVMFSHAITRRGGRALVLAHRDELILQAADKIRQVAPGLGVGIVKAGQNAVHAEVVVASVQTLARERRRERLTVTGGFRTIIVDEAHHAAARTYREVLEDLGSYDDNGPLTIGFTATAGRADEIALDHVWQKIVYQRGILQMILDGYLVDVHAKEVGSDLDLSAVRTRRGDYADDDLGAAIEASDAINHAAMAYVQHAPERRGIAFTPTVRTSQQLAVALNGYGIRAEHLDGTMPREPRRAILARLHRGETQVVTNCMVLTEGFDEPAVSCILNLRPTKSASLFVQMVGRALRPFPGKVDALVLDVAGASDLGLATIADLGGKDIPTVQDGETLVEAIERHGARLEDDKPRNHGKTRKVDLFAASRLRWLPVDDSHVLAVDVDLTLYLIPSAADVERWDVFMRPKGGTKVERRYRDLALDYAMGVGEELARGSGVAKASASWRRGQPSPGQVGMLTRFGYGAVTHTLDRGQASDLITAHKASLDIPRIKAVRA